MMSKTDFLEYGQIILGCFIGSLGLTMFLIPNKIAAGGVSGLATVLHYLFDLPVGWSMLALNIPLFIAGVRVLGGGFGIKTVVGAVFFFGLHRADCKFSDSYSRFALIYSVRRVCPGCWHGFGFSSKGFYWWH